MNLFKFEDRDPPEITEKKPVHHPDEPDTIMGFLGTCNRDTPCFVSQRTRHGATDVQDYFRKHGGYSMVTHLLERLDAIGVESVFVDETDNERFVEYRTSDFLIQGADVPDHRGHPQKCLPVADAIRTWPAEEVRITRGSNK